MWQLITSPPLVRVTSSMHHVFRQHNCHLTSATMRHYRLSTWSHTRYNNDSWWTSKKALRDTDLPGSVKQNAATCSPVASFGRYFAFCCSVPINMIPCKRLYCTRTRACAEGTILSTGNIVHKMIHFHQTWNVYKSIECISKADRSTKSLTSCDWET